MPRGARIAVASLSVLLAISIGGFVWLYVNDKAQAAEWALKDAERVQQREDALREAAEENKASLAAVVQRHALEKADLTDQLTAARKRRQARSRPTSLGDCESQLEERDAELVIVGSLRTLDLEIMDGLEAALAHQTRRGDILEAVVADEIDRADGWREYARKNKRRDRVKMAFIGIGSAVGGVGLGYVWGNQ